MGEGLWLQVSEWVGDCEGVRVGVATHDAVLGVARVADGVHVRVDVVDGRDVGVGVREHEKVGETVTGVRLVTVPVMVGVPDSGSERVAVTETVGVGVGCGLWETLWLSVGDQIPVRVRVQVWVGLGLRGLRLAVWLCETVRVRLAVREMPGVGLSVVVWVRVVSGDGVQDGDVELVPVDDSVLDVEAERLRLGVRLRDTEAVYRLEGVRVVLRVWVVPEGVNDGDGVGGLGVGEQGMVAVGENVGTGLKVADMDVVCVDADRLSEPVGVGDGVPVPGDPVGENMAVNDAVDEAVCELAVGSAVWEGVAEAEGVGTAVGVRLRVAVRVLGLAVAVGDEDGAVGVAVGVGLRAEESEGVGVRVRERVRTTLGEAEWVGPEKDAVKMRVLEGLRLRVLDQDPEAEGEALAVRVALWVALPRGVKVELAVPDTEGDREGVREAERVAARDMDAVTERVDTVAV